MNYSVNAFICLFTLSSCTYTPVNDFYKIRNKTSLKDISTLNNPVIFAKTPVQGFSHGKKVEYVDFGVVYCIYDWENNEIIPWNDYASQIISVEIPETVTGFGWFAFSSCSEIFSSLEQNSTSKLSESDGI